MGKRTSFLLMFLLIASAVTAILPSVNALNETIYVPRGSKPVIDGLIEPGEWSRAANVSFATDGGICTIYFKHDGSSLYVAFDMPYQKSESAAQVFLDTNNDKATAPQTDDWRLFITRSGLNYKENRGTGTTWGSANIPSGWMAMVQVIDSSRWNAEFNISFAKLSITEPICDKVTGIMFINAWTGSGDYYWPYGAFWTNPSTWATAYWCQKIVGGEIVSSPIPSPLIAIAVVAVASIIVVGFKFKR